MANIKSQKKRIITAEKARKRNQAVKSELKTAVRAVREAVAAGNGVEAYTKAQHACRLLDKAVSKGVIHKNTAANKKSRLSARLSGVKSGKIVIDIKKDNKTIAAEKAQAAREKAEAARAETQKKMQEKIAAKEAEKKAKEEAALAAKKEKKAKKTKKSEEA